ncbi:hypothetical protein SNEBB_005110 [Seison nebaliae]|nr:hypothetical protein SNEBB_005110 [Seison nebaliae]
MTNNSSIDYYEVLGITTRANAQDVVQAYRRLAKKLHPDKNDAKDATERFKQIQKAYETLKDPLARRKYDITRPSSYSASTLSFRQKNSASSKNVRFNRSMPHNRTFHFRSTTDNRPTQNQTSPKYQQNFFQNSFDKKKNSPPSTNSYSTNNNTNYKKEENFNSQSSTSFKGDDNGQKTQKTHLKHTHSFSGSYESARNSKRKNLLNNFNIRPPRDINHESYFSREKKKYEQNVDDENVKFNASSPLNDDEEDNKENQKSQTDPYPSLSTKWRHYKNNRYFSNRRKTTTCVPQCSTYTTKTSIPTTVPPPSAPTSFSRNRFFNDRFKTSSNPWYDYSAGNRTTKMRNEDKFFFPAWLSTPAGAATRRRILLANIAQINERQKSNRSLLRSLSFNAKRMRNDDTTINGTNQTNGGNLSSEGPKYTCNAYTQGCTGPPPVGIGGGVAGSISASLKERHSALSRRQPKEKRWTTVNHINELNLINEKINQSISITTSTTISSNTQNTAITSTSLSSGKTTTTTKLRNPLLFSPRITTTSPSKTNKVSSSNFNGHGIDSNTTMNRDSGYITHGSGSSSEETAAAAAAVSKKFDMEVEKTHDPLGKPPVIPISSSATNLSTTFVQDNLFQTNDPVPCLKKSSTTDGETKLLKTRKRRHQRQKRTLDRLKVSVDQQQHQLQNPSLTEDNLNYMANQNEDISGKKNSITDRLTSPHNTIKKKISTNIVDERTSKKLSGISSRRTTTDGINTNNKTVSSPSPSPPATVIAPSPAKQCKPIDSQSRHRRSKSSKHSKSKRHNVMKTNVSTQTYEEDFLLTLPLTTQSADEENDLEKMKRKLKVVEQRLNSCGDLPPSSNMQLLMNENERIIEKSQNLTRNTIDTKLIMNDENDECFEKSSNNAKINRKNCRRQEKCRTADYILSSKMIESSGLAVTAMKDNGNNEEMVPFDTNKLSAVPQCRCSEEIPNNLQNVAMETVASAAAARPNSLQIGTTRVYRHSWYSPTLNGGLKQFTTCTQTAGGSLIQKTRRQFTREYRLATGGRILASTSCVRISIVMTPSST